MIFYLKIKLFLLRNRFFKNLFYRLLLYFSKNIQLIYQFIFKKSFLLKSFFLSPKIFSTKNIIKKKRSIFILIWNSSLILTQAYFYLFSFIWNIYLIFNIFFHKNYLLIRNLVINTILKKYSHNVVSFVSFVSFP